MHLIVPARAPTRCRGCRQLCAPSELVFGQEVRDAFGEPDETTHLWFHLECAAQLRPGITRAALAQYPGPLPHRERVERILDRRETAPLLALEPRHLEQRVHPVLAAVLLRFAPPTWPAPIHLGGARPVLSSKRHAHSRWIPAGAARVAVWCVREAIIEAGLAGPGALRRLRFLERCLLEADDESLRPPPTSGLRHNPFAALRPPGDDVVSFGALKELAQGEADDDVDGLLKRAAQQCVAAITGARPGPDATGCALDAAMHLVDVRPDALPAFFAGLDAQLLAQEAQALFDERAPRHLPVRRVLWREAGQVFAQLDDGAYGLLVKQKGRWQVFAGERDEVLACVPDASFADVTAAALADASR